MPILPIEYPDAFADKKVELCLVNSVVRVACCVELFDDDIDWRLVSSRNFEF